MSFLNGKGSTVSNLDIRIVPKGYFIDKSFHIFKGENEYIRKIIKYSPNLNLENPSQVFDPTDPRRRFVRSNKSDVVASLQDDKVKQMIKLIINRRIMNLRN